MKRKQRTKAELLNNLRTYKAIKYDERTGDEISKRAAFWRMGVEWSVTLWKEENFSSNEIGKFLQYIINNNVVELGDEKRNEVRQQLKDKKIEWTLINKVPTSPKSNAIDQAIQELQYYNTKVCVDYSLLACEYLMQYKGYAKKRLDRVIGDVMALDRLDANMTWQLREDLYDNKGIWIEIKDDMPLADMKFDDVVVIDQQKAVGE